MKVTKIKAGKDDRIRLEFNYHKEIIEKIKQIEGCSWSRLFHSWLLPYDLKTLEKLRSFFPELEEDDEVRILREPPKPVITNSGKTGKTVIISKAASDPKKFFTIEFEEDERLKSIISSFPGVQWSDLQKVWLLPNNAENLRKLFSSFKGEAWVDASRVFGPSPLDEILKKKQKPGRPSREALQPITPEMEEHIRKFSEWIRSIRYSESTLKTYTDGLRIFFRYVKNKPVEEITNEDLLDFNNNYILRNGFSSSFQNQVINAIKLYFTKLEKRRLEIESIERPRREKKLPNVLNRKEIESLLTAAKINLKHQAMLSLIYSCGLRRGELLSLKIRDIDSTRGLLNILNAKGKKDRICPLSEKTIQLLRNYYEKYRPAEYLFEGWEQGSKYSARSLEEVMKKYLKLAGINKPASLHWLRHSYATHLLENGTDLRYIQEILGHKSSKTTEIYTHVSTRYIQQIKSPFDDIDL